MPILFSLALDKSLDLLGTALGQGLLVVLLAAAAVTAWLLHRRSAAAPPRVREFTLLRTEGTGGSLVRYETTLPIGTKITPWVGGRQRLYELTGVQLEDGTYAAEPIDHL